MMFELPLMSNQGVTASLLSHWFAPGGLANAVSSNVLIIISCRLELIEDQSRPLRSARYLCL